MQNQTGIQKSSSFYNCVQPGNKAVKSMKYQRARYSSITQDDQPTKTT